MLKIQRASAGSGKTYTLTLQYILNLIAYKKENDKWYLKNEKQIEDALQHILAITFTNKATNEMKERIVESLSILSTISDTEEIDTKNIGKYPYLSEIQNITKSTYPEIGQAAKAALKIILNNYSFFKISTIDSFFQEILRTFTYEANISDSYQLEIDSSYINDEALSLAYQKLDTNPSKMGNSSFWLKAIMNKEAQKSQQWNPFIRRSNSKSVYNRIRKALTQLENEDFKDIKDKLDLYYNNEENSVKLLKYYNSLKEKAFLERERQLKDIKKSIILIEELMQRNEYDMMQLNSYFLKHLSKLSNLSIKDSITFKFDSILKEGSVFKKKYRIPNHPLDQEAVILYNLLQTWNNPSPTSYYKNWKIYGELLPYLGLIIEIRFFLSRVLNSKNIIQLHDTSYILKKIIGEDDVPFIFEKLGNTIDNFLIDEFQDTSQLQWDVIKPLIGESIAQNKDSLIIGDPKQSIYRFRNAKHSLITEIVPDTFKEHIIAGFSKKENTNWRSHTNIVKFNNYFFTALTDYLNILSKENGGKTDFKDLYSNVIQYPSHQEGKGYVEIKIFDKPSEDFSESFNDNLEGSDGEKKDWFDNLSLNSLGPLISSLIEKGYNKSDIGVLVNTNEKGKEIVKYLIDYNSSLDTINSKIDFISEESLLISSSPAIEVIINVLEKISDPSYYQNQKNEDSKSVNKYYDWNKLKTDYTIFSHKHKDLSASEKIFKFLDDSGFDNNISTLLKELSVPTITSIVEMIIKTFLDDHLRKSEAIYLSSFQDLVNEYSTNYQNDPGSFLEWWNAKGKNMSVSPQSSLNAVNIMTIHKSKGLEFKCVIIPFATDSFSPNALKEEWKWVRPIDLEGLEKPPVLPIKMAAELKDSMHKDIFEEYTDQVVTDKLNMYYVAFTRAKNELYIFTKNPGKKTNSFGDIIKQISSGQVRLDNPNESDKESLISPDDIEIDFENNIFTLGKPFTSEEIINEKIKDSKRDKTHIHYFNDYFVNQKRPRLRSVASKVLPSGELSK